MTATIGFTPPPYPYDRLEELRAVADRLDGGLCRLVGRHTDRPSTRSSGRGARRARAPSGATRRRSAPSPFAKPPPDGWARRFGVDLDPNHLAACIGTKEFVAGVPHWLRLRRPDRDVVLYPAISYPSYAMGATLAGATAGGGAGRRELPARPRRDRRGRRRPCVVSRGSTRPATPQEASTTWVPWRHGVAPMACRS